MSWLRKLFGRRAPDTAARDADAEPAALRSYQLADGALTVHVHRHEVERVGGALPCWTLVSEGLAAHRQDEIVLTLVRAASSARAPREALKLMETLAGLAAAGRLVEVGGFTMFGGAGFLGRHLVYVGPQRIAGLELPAQRLHALLVTADELRLFAEHGLGRLLSQLTRAESYFPLPFWSDPARPPLAIGPMLEHSLLGKLGRAQVRGLSAVRVGDTIQLIARPPMSDVWSETLRRLREGPPLALLTDPEPSATGWLLWTPGGSPTAIAPDRSSPPRLGGHFVLLTRDAERDDGMVVEDGFAMQLTADSWLRLLAALANGESVELPAQGEGLGLMLQWRGAAQLERVELLTSQDSLAAAVDLDDLARYCDRVRDLAEQCFKTTTHGCKVAVQFSGSGDGQRFELQYQGEAERPLLERFHDELERLPPLAARAELGFRVCLEISTQRTRS